MYIYIYILTNLTNAIIDVYEVNNGRHNHHDITNAKVMRELALTLCNGGQYSKILAD